MTMGSHAWPTEIRLRDGGRTLAVTFDDGDQHRLAAEYLRVESPSAEVQGHGPGEKVIVAGKRDVSIVAIEPVGGYAVRLRFSDGHATGLYSWPYLRRLGAERDRLWDEYLAELEARGLRREL